MKWHDIGRAPGCARGASTWVEGRVSVALAAMAMLGVLGGCGSGGGQRDDGGVACGQEGQACCAMAQCEDGLQCLEGICQHGRVGNLGKECDNNFDCEGRLCLPVAFCSGCSTGDNVCTLQCSSSSDCTPGWECLALAGTTGKVCQCAETGSEECDAIDNDCDGIVDNLPEVDWVCRNVQVGYVCRGGTCKCGTMCGNQCVDTAWDSQNCGGCGQACRPPAGLCMEGVCRIDPNQADGGTQEDAPRIQFDGPRDY